MKLFGKQSMYQKWYKTPNKKIVLSCLAGICSYWHEVNEAFSGFRRGRGGGGGWGKRSCCYFTIGLIFGDFPRRYHIFNPSSCRCCQLAFLLSYVAVSWQCSWSEFNVSGIASISVVCFTERKRELGNEVGGGGGMGPGPSSPYF